MSPNDKILHAAFAGLLAIGLAQSAGAQDDKGDKEKCYGVAKAGQNDCGTAQHACAGRSTRDDAGDEWISLPAGTCARIAGGRLKSAGT